MAGAAGGRGADVKRVKPKILKVYRDTREKKSHRLLFPDNLPYYLDGRPYTIRVEVEDRELEAGDYTAEDSEIGVEKKQGVRELHTNLFTVDRTRALKAFQKMSHYISPVLLLASSPAALLRNHTFGAGRHAIRVSGPRVFAELSRVCHIFAMDLWIVGACLTPNQRHVAGELVARRFLVDRLIREDYYAKNDTGFLSSLPEE